MNSLSDTELAKAGQDLASWVLQDDFLDQDFCYGAKETQFHSAVFPELASPFNPIPDEPMEMLLMFDDCIFVPSSIKKETQSTVKESPLSVFIDDDFDLQELMKEEIVKQQELDQLQFIKEQEEQESLLVKLQYEVEMKEREHVLLREQEHLMLSQQNENPTIILNDEQDFYVMKDENSQSDFQEIIFGECPMAEEMDISSGDSPIYYMGNPQVTEAVETDNSPCIISVPVSEAFDQQNNHTFVFDESELSKRKPEKFVINLKKVTIPKKTFQMFDGNFSSPTIVVDSSEPTLKDIIETDSADDVISDFIRTPNPSSPRSSTSGDCGNSFLSLETSYSGLLTPRSDWSSILSSPCSSMSDTESAPNKPKGATYSTTERKYRKKDQNRRAALRYRQKKKEEEDSVSLILQGEEERRRLLIERYNNIRTELKVVTKLAKEMIAIRNKTTDV